MQFGSLSALRTPLYEKGGRLYGVCKAKDLSTGVRVQFRYYISCFDDNHMGSVSDLLPCLTYSWRWEIGSSP